MTLAADDNPVAVPTVLIVVIIGGIIYTFGYLRAVMHRANKDYKTTKAAVPTLRKAFWKAWVDALKIGALILLAVVILGAWVVAEVRGSRTETSNTKPSPAPSSHAPSRHSKR